MIAQVLGTLGYLLEVDVSHAVCWTEFSTLFAGVVVGDFVYVHVLSYQVEDESWEICILISPAVEFLVPLTVEDNIYRCWKI